MMTKSDTIEAILALNQSATRTFLAEFSVAELTEYLGRLNRLALNQPTSPIVNYNDIRMSSSAASGGQVRI